MTELGRSTVVVLLLGYAAAQLAGAGSVSSSLGQPRAPSPCPIPVEQQGRGVACLDADQARRDHLRSGDRVALDDTHGRMVPSRLALFAVPVDPNTASLDELASLPGIGVDLAARFTEGRPYAAVDDLRRVPGIGARRLASIRSRLIIEPHAIPHGADPAADPADDPADDP